MTVSKRLIALIAMAGFLAACTSPIDRFYGLSDAPTADERIKECIKAYIEEEKKDESANVHTFLDCIFKDPTGTVNSDVPQENLALRLFRAHAIVGGLTVYGAFSMKYDRLANRENAAVLLGAVEKAELELWNARSANANPPHGYVAQATVDFFDRIRLVYKVAKAAARPGIIRARNFVERLVTAIAVENPLAIIGTIKDARRAVSRALTARRYSAAYIKGIRDLIAEIKMARSGTPSDDDWKAIDGFYLNQACETLADIAEVSTHHCVPGDRT